MIKSVVEEVIAEVLGEYGVHEKGLLEDLVDRLSIIDDNFYDDSDDMESGYVDGQLSED